MRLRFEITRWDLFKAALGAQVFKLSTYLIAVPVLALMWWYFFQFGEGLNGSDTVSSVIFATLLTLVSGVGSLVVMILLPVLAGVLRAGPGRG